MKRRGDARERVGGGRGSVRKAMVADERTARFLFPGCGTAGAASQGREGADRHPPPQHGLASRCSPPWTGELSAERLAQKARSQLRHLRGEVRGVGTRLQAGKTADLRARGRLVAIDERWAYGATRSAPLTQRCDGQTFAADLRLTRAVRPQGPYLAVDGAERAVFLVTELNEFPTALLRRFKAGVEAARKFLFDGPQHMNSEAAARSRLYLLSEWPLLVVPDKRSIPRQSLAMGWSRVQLVSFAIRVRLARPPCAFRTPRPARDRRRRPRPLCITASGSWAARSPGALGAS